MKLSQTLNDALNQQVFKEYKNMLSYKQIESYFEELQLKNLAKYFKNQSQHEKDHGDSIVDYINSRTGGKVVCEQIDAPGLVLSNPESIANAYILLEEETTLSIEEIYDLVLSEKSYMDLGFIEKLLNEQVEEEDSAQEFSLKLRSVKDIVLFDATFGE